MQERTLLLAVGGKLDYRADRAKSNLAISIEHVVVFDAFGNISPDDVVNPSFCTL